LLWQALGLACLIALTGSNSYAAHPEVSLPGSEFEIDTDANLMVDDASPPSIDWEVVAADVKADEPTGSDDDAFGQGSKEDSPVPSVVSGSIPPNKSDLKTFGVYLETNASGRFLHMFWHRVQEPTGTTNMDFEFNQSDQTSANLVTPVRTDGDLLIQYDLAQGGTHPELFLSYWIDGSGGETADDCEASNKLPCWGIRENLTSSGDATGSINTSMIMAADAFPSDSDPTLGDISPRTFGEASIDFDAITADGVCTSFGSAYLKSRSSDSFTAALKDFIAPQAISVSNCGTLKITKIDDTAAGNLLAGAMFELRNDNSPFGGSPGAEDDLVNSCTTAANGTCTILIILAGNYWVVETVAPTGYDLASPPYQLVTVNIDAQASVTFIDPRQLGAIKVTKTRKHAADGSGDHAHEGVTFTFSGGSLTSPVDKVTDANGEACLDGLVLSTLTGVGDYTVTETVPTGYAVVSTNPQTVSVTAKGTCSSGTQATVSFSNMPLTDITVSVDSKVDGGTASTINCGSEGSGSTGANGDGSLTLSNLQPGTYSCTIVVDP